MYDAAGKGYITIENLRDIVRCAAVNTTMSEEQISGMTMKIMQTVDTNSSSTITFDELKQVRSLTLFLYATLCHLTPAVSLCPYRPATNHRMCPASLRLWRPRS